MDIGVEILGYAAKEGAASEFGLTQHVGDEGGGGGFAMGTGNGDAAFALRELSEELGTLHDGYAFLEQVLVLGRVGGYGGGIDDLVDIGGNERGIVVEVYRDTFLLQMGGEG